MAVILQMVAPLQVPGKKEEGSPFASARVKVEDDRPFSDGNAFANARGKEG